MAFLVGSLGPISGATGVWQTHVSEAFPKILIGEDSADHFAIRILRLR